MNINEFAPFLSQSFPFIGEFPWIIQMGPGVPARCPDFSSLLKDGKKVTDWHLLQDNGDVAVVNYQLG